MSQRPQKPAPVVVKRPPEQRRKLPPDLEAFARSDDEKLRIRRPRVDRGLIRDPREGYTVAGVANRDARSVYDVRSVAMRALWDEGAAEERALETLGQLFHDALRLELWHARRLTSFAAFAEEVVGVPAEKAEALADEAALRTGEPATPLTEVAIALWLRTEAGLYEGDEGGRARVRSGDRGLVLEIVVDLVEASTALAGVGARHLPLARSVPAREESRGGHDDRRSYEEPRAARAPVESSLARPGARDDRSRPVFGRAPERAPERALGPLSGRSRVEPELDEQDDELVVDDELPGALADAGANSDDEGGELDDAEPLDEEPLDEVEDGDSPLADPKARFDEVEPQAVLGGARLLTRKAQPREELEDGEPAAADGEGWGHREERAERPASTERRDDGPRSRREERPKFGGTDRGGSPRPDRGGERPKFGGDRGGERPKFGNDGGGERPKFGSDRGGERPKFGGDRGAERPKFGSDRGAERPKFGGDRGGERPKFGGDRGAERPKFGGDRGAERPKFGSDRGGERPKFGGDRGGERPTFGGDRAGERPRFGGGGDRPRAAGGFTQGSERGGNNARGERPQSGHGERPRFGGGDRPRFGGGDKPARAGGFTSGNDRGVERPRFGGNDRGGERPRFGGQDKPQRAGGFVEGPTRPAGGDKRPPGKGFGARQSFSGNAPTGRDRDPTRAPSPSQRRNDDGEE